MALPVSWKPLVKSKASAVITTMIRRNKSMFTAPDSRSRGLKLSNAEIAETQVYLDLSSNVGFSLTGRSPGIAAGIAAQRVVPRDLDENQRDAVRIDHVHLV